MSLRQPNIQGFEEGLKGQRLLTIEDNSFGRVIELPGGITQEVIDLMADMNVPLQHMGNRLLLPSTIEIEPDEKEQFVIDQRRALDLLFRRIPDPVVDEI